MHLTAGPCPKPLGKLSVLPMARSGFGEGLVQRREGDKERLEEIAGGMGKRRGGRR